MRSARTIRALFWRLLAAPLLLAGMAAAAQGQATVDGPIEQLRPGEFLWAPEIAPAGPVTIIVSLALQRAYVYRNGVPIGVSTVSTGKPGHATPTGVFTILQKDVNHRSSKYDNAPMPFMQRLTWDGVALHGGQLPGRPASHGCIRLPLAFARQLFAITRLGVTVIVTDAAQVPQVAPTANPPLAASEDGHALPAEFDWTPERSPAGPVSIVVSGRDRSVVVLRNGIRIGVSSVVLDEPVTTTAAFTLRAIDAQGPHWLRLPLPGNPAAGVAELTPAEQAKGHVPEGFRKAIEAVLEPGATMLVTRDTLKSGGTGTKVRLFEAR